MGSFCSRQPLELGRDGGLKLSLVKWNFCGSDGAGHCPKVTSVTGGGRGQVRFGLL